MTLQQQQNDYPSSPMLLSSPTSDDVNDGTSTSNSKNNNNNQYKILCTTDNVRMQWGSYIIRCQDLKTWSKRCAKDVQIITLSHEQIHGMLKNKKNNKRNPPLELLNHINATVSIKKPFHPPPTTSKTFRRKNMFGRMFLDVVDNYDITTHNITTTNNKDDDLEIIVQNDYHGQDMFYDRKYHVVEHWYNSFPLDMLSSNDDDDSSNGIPTTFDLPQIRPISDDNDNSYLEMATIWTNQLQPCPSFLQQPLRVHYHCIDETYKIETWYQKYFYNNNHNHNNNNTLEEQEERNKKQQQEQERLEQILADPNQGPGRLYYELFWNYDVLVIPVKTAFMPKLRYGNVQRAVSQMRSGVPVLLEIYGEVLEDFMDKYNYTCAYVMKNNNHNQTRSM
eukprot:scaffold4823_cov57-Cylindrotheca_fusiformis.AAC.1